ncbi:MAG: hypothetical protein JNK14_06760 [Chitinophagaceae bacterium]|nr:hypothetical protein [Chitinophagaceae bacterium]
MSIPHAYHQTKAFKVLRDRIYRYFKAKGIPVTQHSPEAFHSFCPSGEKKVKQAMMHTLATQFPELTYVYHKERRNKTRYYIKLFEAVAVAVHEEQKH